MAYDLSWSPMARLDLIDLHAYISESNPQTANRFARSLIDSVERLIVFPESGRIVPEFDDPVIREVIRRPFRIVYRVWVDVSLIEIVRVWHSARGVPEI